MKNDKKIFVFGTGVGKEIVRCCIKKSTNIEAYIDNDVAKQGSIQDGIFVYSIEHLPKDSLVIISVMKYKDILFQLIDYGISPLNIIPFFSVTAEEYPDFVSLFNVNKWRDSLMEWGMIVIKNTDNYSECDKSIANIKIDGKRKVIFIGDNEEAKYFVNLFKSKYENESLIFDEEYSVERLCEKMFPLLCEDIENLKIFIIEPYKALKIKGDLLEIGIKEEDIVCIGKPLTTGSKLQDLYDPMLGYTWKGDLPGFMRFGTPGDDVLRIVTLGGSTTDATLYNIKSYSEWLYEIMTDMGIKVEVLCGGIAGYTVSQELQKLYRDVLNLKPDLVISYSGINDSRDFYTTSEYPFTRFYQTNNLVKMINKNLLVNDLFGDIEINDICLGVGECDSKAMFWLKCERLMHAICEEFDISFIAFLQPYNKDCKESYMTNVVKHYFEKKEILKSNNWNDWLHDFTELFDKDTCVFIDNCHVYERGNKIIARRMIPYIIKALKKESKL